MAGFPLPLPTKRESSPFATNVAAQIMGVGNNALLPLLAVKGLGHSLVAPFQEGLAALRGDFPVDSPEFAQAARNLAFAITPMGVAARLLKGGKAALDPTIMSAGGAGPPKRISGPPEITPPPDFGPLREPRMAPRASERIVAAAADLFQSGKIKRQPDMLVSDQIASWVFHAEAEDIAALALKHQIDPPDLAKLWRGNVRQSAQELQRLSVINRRLNLLNNSLDNMKDAAKAPGQRGARARADLADIQKGEFTEPLGWWRWLGQKQRQFAVTQLGTAAANAGVATMRLGLGAALDVMDAGLNMVMRPVGLMAKDAPQRTVFSAIGLEVRNVLARSPLAKLEGALNGLGLRSGQPRPTTRQAFEAAFPEGSLERGKLTRGISGDVPTGTGAGGRFRRTVDKAADIALTFNKVQEYFFRRPVAVARLDKLLRAKGQSIDRVVREGTLSEHITAEMMQDATRHALDFTFALPPSSRMGRAFVEVSQALGPLSFAVNIPFAKFMTNALRFTYEHSGGNAWRLLTPKEWAKIHAGDTSTISKSMIGLGMLYTAFQIRRDPEIAGELWYEIRTGDGRTIDARRYAPILVPQLALADFVIRMQEGRMEPGQLRELFEGMSGLRGRFDTGLDALDSMLTDLATLDDPGKLNRMLGRLAGDQLRILMTPLQTVRDMYAEFDGEERKVRETRTDPATQKPLSAIPGVSQTLPELESPTRSAVPMRQEPMARQLLGMTVKQAKNPAEAALDRLGISFRSIAPRLGDPELERAINAELGPLVEQVIGTLVQSEGFKTMNNETQTFVVQRALAEVRSAAVKLAIAKNPEFALKIKNARMGRAKRRMLHSMGVDIAPAQ